MQLDTILIPYRISHLVDMHEGSYIFFFFILGHLMSCRKTKHSFPRRTLNTKLRYVRALWLFYSIGTPVFYSCGDRCGFKIIIKKPMNTHVLKRLEHNFKFY